MVRQEDLLGQLLSDQHFKTPEEELAEAEALRKKVSEYRASVEIKLQDFCSMGKELFSKIDGKWSVVANLTAAVKFWEIRAAKNHERLYEVFYPKGLLCIKNPDDNTSLLQFPEGVLHPILLPVRVRAYGNDVSAFTDQLKGKSGFYMNEISTRSHAGSTDHKYHSYYLGIHIPFDAQSIEVKARAESIYIDGANTSDDLCSVKLQSAIRQLINKGADQTTCIEPRNDKSQNYGEGGWGASV